MILACMATPLTSCDNEEPQIEEEQKHNPASDEDLIPINGIDALEYLQCCIVVVDENGDVVRRVFGKPLDNSDPSVISVPVNDYAMAEQTFLGWVAPGKEATKVENGYDYYLTNENGNAQGSVSFRAVDDETGVVARMSVAKGTDLKHVSEVKFIKPFLLSDNDESEMVVVKDSIYNLEAEFFEWWPLDANMSKYAVVFKKELPFYCIQGNENGYNGILVWLCPDVNDWHYHPVTNLYIRDKVYQYLPSIFEISMVKTYFDENYDSWQNMIKKMESLGHKWDAHWGLSTTGNAEFVFNRVTPSLSEIYCLDLDDKKSKICNVRNGSWFKYRYMHVRVIPPVSNQ